MLAEIAEGICYAACITYLTSYVNPWASVEVFRSFLAHSHMFHQVSVPPQLATVHAFFLLPLGKSLHAMNIPHVASKVRAQE